jgi:putative hydrolase of HD superfamily
MKRKNKKSDYSRILDFIAEAGLLKRVKRSGWWVLGIEGGESVADHSFRCAVIGYLLAKMENVNAGKVLMMTLFNDIHEARISDLHKMAQRYIDGKTAEDKAFDEQVYVLPKIVGDDLSFMHKTYRAQDTKESIVARDADILECLIQAKEYQEHGFKEAVRFTKKAPLFLKTASAKKLWQAARTHSFNDWWNNLSTFER